MIKYFMTTISMFFSIAIFAQSEDCLSKAEYFNWPKDQFELILSCELNSVNVGQTDYDRLCFSKVKKQFSNYKMASYQTLRYMTKSTGSLLTIVDVDVETQSAMGDDESIKFNDQQVEISSKKYSFSDGQRWSETTKFNPNQLDTILFQIADKKFFSSRVSLSAKYSCVRLK